MGNGHGNPGGGAGNGSSQKPTGGDLVPVFWQGTPRDVDEWTNRVAGHIEEMAAADIATKKGYEELATLGDARILTLFLKTMTSRPSRNTFRHGSATQAKPGSMLRGIGTQ